MPHKYFENFSQKPRVYLFADPDSLGLSIIDFLLSNLCEVIVVTSQTETWKKRTSLLKENSYFKIISTSDEIRENDLSYSIFIDVYLNRSKKEIEKAIKINNQILGKKFVLLPYSIYSHEQKSLFYFVKNSFLEKTADTEYFYIGDILGPNINPQSYIYQLILNLKKSILIRNNSYIYPLLARDVSKELTENLFSFGPPSKEVAFLGPEISVTSFLELVSKIDLNYESKSQANGLERMSTGKYIKSIFDINLNYSLRETIDWLENNFDHTKDLNLKVVHQVRKKEYPLPKIKFLRDNSKKMKKGSGQVNSHKINYSLVSYFVFSFLLILFTPFLLLAVSTTTFLASLNLLEKGSIKNSVALVSVGTKTTKLTDFSFDYLSQIPLVGEVYLNFKFIPDILGQGYKIVDRSLDIYSILNGLPSKIVGNEAYSISTLSKDSSLELDALYKEVDFLIGEIDSLEKKSKQLVFKYIPSSRLTELKEVIYFAKEICKRLDGILGSKNIQTYLILFQNNMELRATGGFIGSFALATFENGRLMDINVQDVYSADGQLKGHVEPPSPIKKYLGEAGWYLRDANWNADFVDSAGKIEWFLDKEIDQKVSGVISIDLEVIKELLKETGPIVLNDYDQVINYENIYEVTQAEVEENFFPGSRKKANFLTALSRQLLEILTSESKMENVALAKTIYKGLEQKHIQLFFHQEDLQKVISTVEYDGAVVPKSCQDNCFYDFASYVDSNVGVNKANYFIERSSNLSILFDGVTVKNILRITVKNNANPLLGDRGRYKSYMRALGLPGSIFGDIKIIEYGQEEIIVPEIESYANYKEAGALFLIGPGEQKTIEFSWTNKLTKEVNLFEPGKFGLFFRKQAGTKEDSLSVNLFVPKYLDINENSSFTLTGQGSYVYNTLLMRDVFPLIYWN